MRLFLDSFNLLGRAITLRLNYRNAPCPVCSLSKVPVCGVVDFNKSCEDYKIGMHTESGIRIPYYLCQRCQFCFAPTIASWKRNEFEERIYNQDYIRFDPDYIETRPRANAEFLCRLFGEERRYLEHLDYGGGNGLLSSILREKEWRSFSFDPFMNGGEKILNPSDFDLVTAFEVFEHAPYPNQLMEELSRLVKKNGIILFSTLLSDGKVGGGDGLSWWYLAPRNGHISLFSSASLTILAEKYGFELASLSEGLHLMWRGSPRWASQLLENKGIGTLST